MKDTGLTREVGRVMQHGVREAKGWKFGPFTFATIETQDVRGYALVLCIGRTSLQCAFHRPNR